jgi:hypothetical protein
MTGENEIALNIDTVRKLLARDGLVQVLTPNANIEYICEALTHVEGILELHEELQYQTDDSNDPPDERLVRQIIDQEMSHLPFSVDDEAVAKVVHTDVTEKSFHQYIRAAIPDPSTDKQHHGQTTSGERTTE